MSYSIRDRAQRKLAQAHKAMETSLGYLAEVATTYESEHPEVSEPLEAVGALVQQVQEALLDIKSSF